MPQYRIDLEVRSLHQAIVDTEWIDDLDDDASIDEVADYFDNLDEWKLQDYVGGDSTWVDDTDVEFTDIHPIGVN